MQLAKYSEVASPKDWPLCWTVLPILTRPGNPDAGGGGGGGGAQAWQVPASAAQHFRLRSPPPFAAVVQHLKNVRALRPSYKGLMGRRLQRKRSCCLRHGSVCCAAPHESLASLGR